MKVFVEGRDMSLFRMFEEEGHTITNDLLEADLLCLEGGADVTPEIYGHVNKHSANSINKDIASFGLIDVAQRIGIAVVGICRGSQAMNVYNGGSMKQHINGHGLADGHGLTFEGERYNVSSVHHQESVPIVDEQFITRADDGCCEIVQYPGMRMFGFQPHPEYHKKGHDCRVLFFSLVDRMFQPSSVM